MESRRSKVVAVLGCASLATLAASVIVLLLDRRAGGCVNDENWDSWRLALGVFYSLLVAALVLTGVPTARIATSLLVWFVLTPIAVLGALFGYVIVLAAIWD